MIQNLEQVVHDALVLRGARLHRAAELLQQVRADVEARDEEVGDLRVVALGDVPRAREAAAPAQLGREAVDDGLDAREVVLEGVFLGAVDADGGGLGLVPDEEEVAEVVEARDVGGGVAVPGGQAVGGGELRAGVELGVGEGEGAEVGAVFLVGDYGDGEAAEDVCAAVLGKREIVLE